MIVRVMRRLPLDDRCGFSGWYADLVGRSWQRKRCAHSRTAAGSRIAGGAVAALPSYLVEKYSKSSNSLQMDIRIQHKTTEWCISRQPTPTDKSILADALRGTQLWEQTYACRTAQGLP